MLKTLRVRQYKSLERIELPLGGLTVLVGPNAAGKSNLIDALRLLQDGLREDMRSAVKRRGDRSVLFESKAQSRWGDAFELEIDCWLPGLPKTAWLDFHLQYDFRYSAGSVREETLDLRKSKPDRWLNRIYSARDGQLEFGVHRANGDAFKSPEPGLLALKAISYLKNFDEVRQVRSFIESWRFLVPEVAKIREPRRLSREDVLESSGGNLANVLRTPGRVVIHSPGQLDDRAIVRTALDREGQHGRRGKGQGRGERRLAALPAEDAGARRPLHEQVVGLEARLAAAMHPANAASGKDANVAAGD